MQFPEGETDKFFVGAEDFNLYHCTLTSHQKSKTHIEQVMSGHHGPLTSLSIHPGASHSQRRAEMTDLILTSSMDWTIKLWNPKQRKTPLYSFEAS